MLIGELANVESGVSDRVSSDANFDIRVRNRRFLRKGIMRRWWLNDDPFATTFYNVHSASFPRGEAAFIDAVREYSDGLPEKLARDVSCFMKQESNHSREHVMFNRLVELSGYDMEKVDQIMAEGIAVIKREPKIVRLGTTMALEHYTAIAAHELLTNPVHMKGMEPRFAEIWRWHAIEEIEHKSVAFDTWLHSTRDWSRLRRWLHRSHVMIVATVRFVNMIWASGMELLSQDGLSGWKHKLRFLYYMVGKPGLYRRMIIPWLMYFKPGFHPWDIDDRDLIEVNELGR